MDRLDINYIDKGAMNGYIFIRDSIICVMVNSISRYIFIGGII